MKAPNLRRLLCTGFVAAAVALTASGCSALFPEPPAPQPSATPPPAKVVKDLDKVNAALKPLAAKHPLPTSKQLFEALTGAGYKPEQLSATIDASPLDHPVSAKMFGVRIADGCIVGEIRKGKVSAQSVAQIKSTDECLIGKVTRPDGVKP